MSNVHFTLIELHFHSFDLRPILSYLNYSITRIMLLNCFVQENTIIAMQPMPPKVSLLGQTSLDANNHCYSWPSRTECGPRAWHFPNKAIKVSAILTVCECVTRPVLQGAHRDNWQPHPFSVIDLFGLTSSAIL